MATPEPYDHNQIDGPYFATFEIVTVKHDPRGNVTVGKRWRSIGTTVLIKPLRFISIARGWGGLCTVCPSVTRPNIRPSRDHRSYGQTNSHVASLQHKIIGQTDKMPYHRSNGRTYKSRLNRIRTHRFIGTTATVDPLTSKAHRFIGTTATMDPLTSRAHRLIGKTTTADPLTTRVHRFIS